MQRKSGIDTLSNLCCPSYMHCMQQSVPADFPSFCVFESTEQTDFNIADSKDQHTVDIPLENGLTHAA